MRFGVASGRRTRESVAVSFSIWLFAVELDRSRIKTDVSATPAVWTMNCIQWFPGVRLHAECLAPILSVNLGQCLYWQCVSEAGTSWSHVPDEEALALRLSGQPESTWHWVVGSHSPGYQTPVSVVLIPVIVCVWTWVNVPALVPTGCMVLRNEFDPSLFVASPAKWGQVIAQRMSTRIKEYKISLTMPSHSNIYISPAHITSHYTYRH